MINMIDISIISTIQFKLGCPLENYLRTVYHTLILKNLFAYLRDDPS